MQPYVAGPRVGLMEAAVRESLVLGRGAQIRHGVDVLDTADALTSETLQFSKGSVSWSYRAPDPVVGQQDDAVAAVRRQASLELAGPVTVNLLTRRFRLWTEWRLLDGTWARWNLGVFLVTNPGAIDDDGTVVQRTLRLADKSYIWSLALLTGPLELPASTVATAWVKADLHTRFGESFFAIPDSTAVVGGNDLLFEPGATWLDVYSRVLNAVGYDQLTADENGLPASEPLANIATRTSEQSYGAGLGKIVQAGTVEPLSPTLPNVLRFSARQGPSLGNIEGNGQYTVTNAATGPGSLAARGFAVEQRIDVDAADQATLVAIGDAEKQRYFAGGGLKFTGQVALNPRHSDRDVISISLPRLAVAGEEWLVTDWTYPLGDLSSDDLVLMPITAEQRVA